MQIKLFEFTTEDIHYSFTKPDLSDVGHMVSTSKAEVVRCANGGQVEGTDCVVRV